MAWEGPTLAFPSAGLYALALQKEGEAEKRMPEGEFEPSPLYRHVADRWNYNPNKCRQW